MIHPFQPKAPDNRNEHPDRLDNVRQLPRAARRGHGGSQQIVESKDVDCIEILQPRPAITFDRRVPAHRSVTHPCRKIDGLHAVFFAPPAKGRSFCCDFPFLGLHLFFQAPVGRENGDLVPPPPQSFGKCANLHRGPAEFQKRSVRFRDVQDSHCSRRIFFSVFAKTLKRNSYSTRCRPRAPISFACSGSFRSASMEVASWIPSPCGTR